MPGGKSSSLAKERRFLPRSQSLSFTEKNPTSTRPPLPEGSPLPKPLCATAALIQARRAKQLFSAYKESSPSLDPRMDAA